MITQESGFKTDEIVDVQSLEENLVKIFERMLGVRVFPTAISIRKWRYSECTGKGRNIGGERGSNWMEISLVCPTYMWPFFFQKFVLYFFFLLPAFFWCDKIDQVQTSDSERRNLHFRIEKFHLIVRRWKQWLVVGDDQWAHRFEWNGFRMMVERVEDHLFMYRRPVYRVFQYLETTE